MKLLLLLSLVLVGCGTVEKEDVVAPKCTSSKTISYVAAVELCESQEVLDYLKDEPAPAAFQ